MYAAARAALLLLAARATTCNGHAYLADPLARNVLHPMDNCPHCMQAGGPGTVKKRAHGVWPSKSVAGSHGLCGDPVQGREPYASISEEPYMVPGNVVASFMAGTTAEFRVAIAAHHMGHVEFRICEHALDGSTGETAAEAQECLNKWVLEREAPSEACVPNDADPDCQPLDKQHPERWYLPPANYATLRAGEGMDQAMVDMAGAGSWATEVYTMRYKIPADLHCEHCTLQFYWSTGNTCLYDGGYFTYFREFQELGWDAAAWSPLTMASWSTCEVSCCGDKTDRYPEEFWNCADISVQPQGVAHSTTHAPTATAVSTTQVPETTKPATSGQDPEPEPEPQPEPQPQPQPGAAISGGAYVFLSAHAAGRITIKAGDHDIVHSNVHPSSQLLVIEKQGGGAIESGDAVFLRFNESGTRLTVTNEGDVHAEWDHQGSWQTLTIEKLGGGAIHDGDHIFLKAHTGKYISVNGDAVGCSSSGQDAHARLTIASAQSQVLAAQGAASCVRNGDCAINAWCQDDAYFQWCAFQGQSGACPSPVCRWEHRAGLVQSQARRFTSAHKRTHQPELPAGPAEARRRRRSYHQDGLVVHAAA